MAVAKEAVEQLIGYEFEPLTFDYTTRDVCIYALGVGAPSDPVDPDELQFVYELSGNGFKALPTFPVLYPGKMIHVLVTGRIGTIEYNPMMLVHGEQYLEIRNAIPTAGHITCYPRITQVYDKGSGLLIVTDTICKDETGNEISYNQSSTFIRGLGGFGGERGSSVDNNVPPDRAPDVVHSEKTLPQQALLYRLSGDINPLHADPAMAAIGGFNKPILHGLCSFGFVGRAVLKHFCNNDPTRFKSIKVRFSKHVFPGETLVTEMWKVSDGKIVFRCKVEERDEIVLSSAAVELQG